MGAMGLRRPARRACPLPIDRSCARCSNTSRRCCKRIRTCWVTVVIPEILPARWWQNILHNQRALMLKGALLFKDRVILTDVPSI